MERSDSALPDERNRTKLRACLLCGLIKTFAQFRDRGCDNCEALLNLRDKTARIHACTSSSFDGMIAQLQPQSSWVAKWQRTDKFTKGMYAIRITGQLPQDVQDILSENQITYRPRDGSVRD
ncbi:transcription elongation factor spt4 [Thoreauomyces humboldtii]|nr:transcription elongation factor spt4 [Thoreauomyces humboldtii]